MALEPAGPKVSEPREAISAEESLLRAIAKVSTEAERTKLQTMLNTLRRKRRQVKETP